MIEKLKIHDGDTPGKVLEVKLEYPKPKVATMSDMKNIYDVLDEIGFENQCEKYALGFHRDTDTSTMTKFRQESMKEFCFSLIQQYAEKVYEDFIRTRKALDVALDWLGQVATPEKCDDDLCREFTKRKLAEIKTALEQKDVK